MNTLKEIQLNKELEVTMEKLMKDKKLKMSQVAEQIMEDKELKMEQLKRGQEGLKLSLQELKFQIAMISKGDHPDVVENICNFIEKAYNISIDRQLRDLLVDLLIK